MQDYKLLNEYEDIGIFKVYAIVTSMDTKYDKRHVIAQKLKEQQASVYYCRQASSTVRLSGSTINYDRNKFLVRTTSIDGAVQKVVPTSLQPCLSHHSYYPFLAKHPGKRGMYDSMRLEYC